MNSNGHKWHRPEQSQHLSAPIPPYSEQSLLSMSKTQPALVHLRGAFQKIIACLGAIPPAAARFQLAAFLFAACLPGRSRANPGKATVLRRLYLPPWRQVEGADFVCGDMLNCPAGNAAVVMLASQCWDTPLVAAVAAKLRSELPWGSLVIDYTDGMRPVFGDPVAQVVVEVSWNRQQRLSVFVNQQAVP